MEGEGETTTKKRYLHKNPFKIVTREDWQAVAPVKTQPLETPVSDLVVFSETGTDWCYTQDECCIEMRKLQKRHMNEGFDDVKYNFLIGMDDRAYEGTGWNNLSSKIEGHEDLDGKAFTVAFIGIYEDWVKSPRLKETLEALLKIGIENNSISSDYKRTDIDCSKGEINYVLDFIEDRTVGKKSLYESPYL